MSSFGHQGLQTIGEKIWKREINDATTEALAKDVEKDEQLAWVEGRLCVNGASSLANIYMKGGKKGMNQDSVIIWEVIRKLYFLIRCLQLCIEFTVHGYF